MNNSAQNKLRGPVGPFGLMIAGIMIVIFILAGVLQVVSNRQMFQRIPSWQSNLLLDLRSFSEKVNRVSCDVGTTTVNVELSKDAPWFVKNQVAITAAKSAIEFFHVRVASVNILVGSKVEYSIKYHVSSGVLSESTNGVNSSP